MAHTELSEEVPESVRDVLLRRVARLGRSAEKVLTAAAVIGPDFDVDLLAGVSGIDDEDIIDVLELAERTALVAPVDTYRYGFRHALIRSALYSEASRARLGRLHRAVAEAIEARAARQPPEADLARHWGLALPPAPDKALQWALAAGAAALAALAPFDAVSWYSRALDLLTADQADDPIRTETLIGLGQAQRRCGDPHFRASLLEAARLAEHQGDAPRMAHAVLALQRGFGSTPMGVDGEHIDLVEKALRLMGTTDLRTRAGLLADLGVELTGVPHFERRKAASDEALATARALGDPGTILRVLNLRYMTIYHPFTFDERLAESAEAVRLAEQVGDAIESFWAAQLRGVMSIEAALPDELARHHSRMLELAAVVGEPTLRWVTTFQRGAVTLLRGDVAGARAAAEEGRELAMRTGQPDAKQIYVGVLADIDWHRGRSADALARVDPARLSPYIYPYVARAWAEAGKSSEAVALLADAASDGFARVPMTHGWLTAILAWGEVATRVGDADAGETLRSILEPLRGPVAYHGYGVGGVVDHIRGELNALTGDLDRAEMCLTTAVRLCERLQAPFHLARAEQAWGRLLLGRGRPGDLARGRELLTRAATHAGQYGCGLVEREARDALATS